MDASNRLDSRMVIQEDYVSPQAVLFSLKSINNFFHQRTLIDDCDLNIAKIAVLNFYRQNKEIREKIECIRSKITSAQEECTNLIKCPIFDKIHAVFNPITNSAIPFSSKPIKIPLATGTVDAGYLVSSPPQENSLFSSPIESSDDEMIHVSISKTSEMALCLGWIMLCTDADEIDSTQNSVDTPSQKLSISAPKLEVLPDPIPVLTVPPAITKGPFGEIDEEAAAKLLCEEANVKARQINSSRLLAALFSKIIL